MWSTLYLTLGLNLKGLSRLCNRQTLEEQMENLTTCMSHKRLYKSD